MRTYFRAGDHYLSDRAGVWLGYLQASHLILQRGAVLRAGRQFIIPPDQLLTQTVQLNINNISV